MFLKKFQQVRLSKVIAALTAMSFMLSVFTSGGWAAPSQMPMPAQPSQVASAAPADYIVPFNIGRITDALNTGNGKVIVNIQDLHAHEETQRNINSILTLLDAKYGISKIYVEGAVGQLSTGWLANLKDESFRNAAVNTLMKDGKLSGAEYYSIKSFKTDILHGIENRNLYIENFSRLDEIYKKRDEIQALTPEIKLLLNDISQQYYSKENQSFLKVVNKYREGKFNADKYFKHLVEKAGAADVNFANYPSVVSFAKIIKLQSSLNNKKIGAQLTELIDSLKAEMPYAEYKKIADLFGKQEEEGTLYLALAKVYSKYGFGGKYKELEKFFEMAQLNQSMNPIDLVMEEKQLTKEILYRFAKTNTEVEVIFLNDTFSTFENYLNNQVSAKEYEFFEKSLPEFKILWKKYVDIAGLPELEKYYDMFDQFYKVNIERNRYFLEQITGRLPKQTQEKIRLIKSSEQKSASKLLENSKNIDVVITGGFHTHDLAKLMGDNGYSYIVITPNVTQDTILSDKNYDTNILKQAQVLQNTFKDMLESSMLNFAESNPIPYIASYMTSFQILQTAENEGLLQNFPSIFSQMIADSANELKNKFKVENLAVETPVKDGNSYKITFAYTDLQGRTQRVERIIAEDAQRLNYDVKEQRVFNFVSAGVTAIVSAVAGVLLAPIALPVAVAASAAIVVTGLFFNIAGLANTNLISKAFDDFGNYVSAKAENPFAAPETQITEISQLTLPNGMTQQEFLKSFEDRLKANGTLAAAVTLKSMFDPSAPRDVTSKSLSTIATVSKTTPNVIYVSPVALFFLNSRSADLAESLISKHEQLHTMIGGQKSEIRTSIESTYNFKYARQVFAALKKEYTGKAVRAKMRKLISEISSFDNMYKNSIEEINAGTVDYSMQISRFLSNSKDFFKLLNTNSFLAVEEMEKVDKTIDQIIEFVLEVGVDGPLKNPYEKNNKFEAIRYKIFNQISNQVEVLRSSVLADIKANYPRKYKEKRDTPRVIDLFEMVSNLAFINALNNAIADFDSSNGTLSDVKKLQEAMANVEINLADGRITNIAKVEALSEALKRLRYTAGGQEYRYTEENALVFKIQTLIGFGIINPLGIDDPVVLADTFMPIAQSAEYVAEALKRVMSYDDLKKYMSLNKADVVLAQIKAVDVLLQDTEFAEAVARNANDAYNASVGTDYSIYDEEAKDNASGLTVRDAGIATNLAGFYALETGIATLRATSRQEQTYNEILQDIIEDKISPQEKELLMRFANATWKTSQPFRAKPGKGFGSRIVGSSNFIAWDSLSVSEQEKDMVQIKAAAGMLFERLKDIPEAGQTVALNTLLQDTEFAEAVARNANDAYNASVGTDYSIYDEEAKDNASGLTVRDAGIATNLAGFYALETGVATLRATSRQEQTYNEILQDIIEDKISPQEKELLMRFANATWKTSQPFRAKPGKGFGSRIVGSSNFIAWDSLSVSEQEKDMVQIKAAAKMLLSRLPSGISPRESASMVYLWLNGGLGENVLARHPIIYALRTFETAMKAAKNANDTAAIQRLSNIAQGNDLFGRGLPENENIYGFRRINPDDFYENENGQIKVDAKGKPVVKETVVINGEEVNVPALTGKATDTPFVVRGEDGIYEFRSIMDIKVNELKGHANATGVQIVGPGGEAVALPLTEIPGVKNEKILARVLGSDATSGLIIQERYNPWTKKVNADGSTAYSMDFTTMNPGGHGTIAFTLVSKLADAYRRYMSENNLILADMTAEQIEQAKQELGDVVFANGDGVNSGPKGRMGAVTLYGVPRQTVDAKGGIFGFINDRMGRLFLYLSELANTPEALKNLFQKYGLEDPYNTPQGFNTNTQQIGVFETGALIAELMDSMSMGTELVFMLMASPAIAAADNRKFEWAIGQIMLWMNANLQIMRSNGTLQGDKVNDLMNKILGKNNEFVTLVISDDSQREEIGFTPYKFVTDIIKYMYGGNVVDSAWIPYNEHGLDINVEGDASKYLYYMYYNWIYLSTEGLTALNLNGDFILNNLNLSAEMTFVNNSGKAVELSDSSPALSNLQRDANGKPILENMIVTIDENGEMSIVTKEGITVLSTALDALANAVGYVSDVRSLPKDIAAAVTPTGESNVSAKNDITILKLNEAIENFDTSAGTMQDVAALQKVMAEVRLNQSDSQELNIAKVDVLAQALLRLKYEAGGKEYGYTKENALVFKMQTLIGFGIINPQGIDDPVVLADTFMPISESQTYVEEALKKVMSYNDLKAYAQGKQPASMVYLWLNGGLGENVLARHPIIYSLRTFETAMKTARDANDTAAIQRLSEIAQGNDLFGNSLSAGEDIYGFTKINPDDFYESVDGQVLTDKKGKPAVKQTVIINGKEVNVPALTGKATDTPFVVAGEDGIYEFRSIMDIKVNELKGHANATGVQIVGPGGEAVAMPLTEIAGVRNEEILRRVLGEDATGGLIVQERYNPWTEYTKEDGSLSYGMDFSVMNPGGHGTIAYSLVTKLMDAYNRYMNGRQLSDLSDEEIAIAKIELGDVVFANGDGVNSGPKGRKGAVTMYGVPRQTVDAKGGIFGFIRDGLGRMFVYLSELGNTPSDLKERFQKYGLEEPFNSPQGFNTNTQQIGVFEVGALFSELTDIMGQEAVFAMMASPTITADNNRKFEWAIGQIMLWASANLEILRSKNTPLGLEVNTIMNRILGETEEFVTLVVSDNNQREEVGFTPYKFVTDIIKYMYGGQVVNGEWVPYNEHGLDVNVEGDASKYLYYMYNNWTYLDTKELTSINVNGDFKLNNLKLEGDVTFINHSGRVVTISPDTFSSLNLPKDEKGRTILKDITISVNKDGTISFPISVIEKASSIFNDLMKSYISQLKVALRDLFIGKSYVDIKAPELKNKSYTFVTAEYTPQIMQQAKTLAAKGINVNIIMPYGGHNQALPEGVSTIRQDIDYVHSDNGNRASVWKYSETDSVTNKNINVYMYSQMDIAADQITETGIKPNISYAYKTLEWLKDRALQRGEYDFGIIDIQRNTEISFGMAQNMFPDAIIATSVSNRVDPIFEVAAQSEQGFFTYLVGAEERFLATSGEQIRNRNKNSYMQTSPIFSTTVDLAKLSLADFNTDSAIEELKSYGFDTMVIKLDVSNTVEDLETLKNILVKAHSRDVKVVIEYGFSEYQAFDNWVNSLDSQLASFRASIGIVQGAKEFIDGVRLDLSQMSEADAKKASEKFMAVRSIINRESADAVFGVKSSYYDASLYRVAKIRPVKIISHENKDALNAVENAWVEFSIGNELYDQQSMDYALTAQDIEAVVKAKTTDIVGIDYYIVKSLKKAEDKTFDTLNMLRNVFLQRVAAFRNTPEGTFGSAKVMAVRQNVLISRNAEGVLYQRLADLRAGRNINAAANEIASVMAQSQLMSDLAAQLKNADAEKSALIVKNIEGYVQGALENTELTNYEKQSGRKINHVVKTNKDLLGKMLVEAKLMLATHGVDAGMNIRDAATDAPYTKELNSRNDEESLRILENENNAEIQKVVQLLNSLNTVSAAEAFEIIQESINILNSLIETDALSANARPIAISGLLVLLVLKADFVPGNIVDTTSDGFRNIAANTRAVLAAA